MKNVEDVKIAGLKFCRQHGFNPERANLAHDRCHVVSGYPATDDGEQLQSGWELAVMFADKYKKLNSLTDLEIEGFCAGVDFRESQPELAAILCEALETL